MKDQEKRLVLQNEALGRIISHLLRNNTKEAIDKLNLEKLNRTLNFDKVGSSWKELRNAFPDVSDEEIDKLAFVKENLGHYVRTLENDLVKKVKDVYFRGVLEKKGKGEISQELFETFGDMNKNWERIVNTESNNMMNQAMIRNELREREEGEALYFRRYEGSANICHFCAEANGVIARWSEEPLDEDTCDDEVASVYIWEGKTNYGRKQADWWTPEGAVHPNCQGIWERYYP